MNSADPVRVSVSRAAELTHLADPVTPCCPWCQSPAAPVPIDDRAILVYNQDWKAARHTNPWMCPDCFQVGGLEDWGYLSQVPAKGI